MDEVAKVIVEGKNISCFNILGKKKVFKNVRISEANLIGHRIILERK